MKYTEDRIDAYLRGEMSPSEKAAFEVEMQQDSALSHEVDMMRMIVGSLKDRQEKLEAMAAWEQAAEERQAARVATSRNIFFRPWIPWVTAFSAAAAVVLGVFLFHPVPSPTLPPDFTSPRTIMRGCDFSEIDSLIEQGHYQEALDAIQSEMAETDSLLQESVRKRDEADYEIQKYEYALKLLRQKLEEIEAKQGSE